MTLGIILVAFWIASSFIKVIGASLNLELDFELEFKCILSCCLIAVFIMGVKGSLNHLKPNDTKKNTRLRKVIGWILVILSIIGITLSIISLIGNSQMELSYGNLSNVAFNTMFLEFAGRDIIFSGLIFAGGYYLIKCGPMYSPIWKRILKVILYSVATFVLLGYATTISFTGWYELLIVFIAMLILGALTTDYVKEPESQITEDVVL